MSTYHRTEMPAGRDFMANITITDAGLIIARLLYGKPKAPPVTIGKMEGTSVSVIGDTYGQKIFPPEYLG